jgi:hypothetical protein
VREKMNASVSFLVSSSSGAEKGTEVYPPERKFLLDWKMERVLPFPSHLL